MIDRRIFRDQIPMVSFPKTLAISVFLGLSLPVFGATSVISDDGSKLVIDCENVTTTLGNATGDKLADFIYEEQLGCEKSIATITVPTKTDTRVVTAGAFLIGITGTEYFGKYNRTGKFTAKDIVITGVPKVTKVTSNSGIGANFRITKVGARDSTLETSDAGYYTFGVYGHVTALVPSDGGVGYSDIQTIELDWTGVKATGKYAIYNSETEAMVWKDFSFTASGTSVIQGEDVKFTTRTNTSSRHCAPTKTNDFSCSYAADFQQILALANVSNRDSPIGCAGVKDFVNDNPDLKDKFVCRKGGATIDCSDIDIDTLVCRNMNGVVVNCSEAAAQNACYTSGHNADSAGYSCAYATSRKGASCQDAGISGECPAACFLEGAQIDCQTVVDMNACAAYGISTDALGYKCQINGEFVPCSTFGSGTCSESATCQKNGGAIACSVYENVLACAGKFGFTPSTSYSCKIGVTQVSCDGMQPANKCDASILACKNTVMAAWVDCSEVAAYNMCSPYGITAKDSGIYECYVDDVKVSCDMAGAAGECPLPKECHIASTNQSVDCKYLNNANQCEAEKLGEFLPYYRCSKGRVDIACTDEIETTSACDTSVCSSVCPFQGVSLDGTTATCVCLEAPLCEGDPALQSGATKCNYGGLPKGNGTRDCICNAEPPCNDLCEWKGSPKKDGTQECACNIKMDCYNPMVCAYGGVNKEDGSCECYATEAPSCSGEKQYFYYGATKINVKTVAEGYCTYGGWCTGQEKDERFRCNENNCPYGAVYKDASKNKNNAARCPYGATL